MTQAITEAMTEAAADGVQDDGVKDDGLKITGIALTGFARSGKDTVGAALVASHGYTRVAFGDGIKARAGQCYLSDLKAVQEWVWASEPGTPEEREAVLRQCREGYHAINRSGINPFTENDAAKKIIRVYLERLGEAFYREFLAELMGKVAALGPDARVVNTRLCRATEARVWTRAGGLLVRVTRPGCGPESPRAQLWQDELDSAGLIGACLENNAGAGANIPAASVLDRLYFEYGTGFMFTVTACDNGVEYLLPERPLEK